MQKTNGFFRIRRNGDESSQEVVVIAYDIVMNRRRNKVVKAVMKYGGRVNLSVFECMLTDSQLAALERELWRLIDPKTDQVVILPPLSGLLCENQIFASEKREKQWRLYFNSIKKCYIWKKQEILDDFTQQYCISAWRARLRDACY